MGARRSMRGERGAVAVEFALVLMPMLVLLFGAIQYGLYFWAMQGGSDIARSAVRAAAVGDAATLACDDFRSDIRTQVDGLTGSGTSATVTRTYIDASSPADGVIKEGDKVRVSVQFKSADLHFPFVPMVHDGLVTSTAEARIDYTDHSTPPQDCS